VDDAVARAQFEEWFADEPTNPDRLLPDLRPYYRPKGGDGLKHWAGAVFGLGASSKLTDAVSLRGSLGWATIGGVSEIVYTAGADFAFAHNEYLTLGVTGGGGSSAFFAGLGFKF